MSTTFKKEDIKLGGIGTTKVSIWDRIKESLETDIKKENLDKEYRESSFFEKLEKIANKIIKKPRKKSKQELTENVIELWLLSFEDLDVKIKIGVYLGDKGLGIRSSTYFLSKSSLDREDILPTHSKCKSITETVYKILSLKFSYSDISKDYNLGEPIHVHHQGFCIIRDKDFIQRLYEEKEMYETFENQVKSILPYSNLKVETWGIYQYPCVKEIDKHGAFSPELYEKFKIPHVVHKYVCTDPECEAHVFFDFLTFLTKENSTLALHYLQNVDEYLLYRYLPSLICKRKRKYFKFF